MQEIGPVQHLETEKIDFLPRKSLDLPNLLILLPKCYQIFPTSEMLTSEMLTSEM